MTEAREISADKAALNVYTMAAYCTEKISQVYKTGRHAMDTVEQKTDNPLLRLTGVAYGVKSANQIFGAFKDVETRPIVEIMKTPGLSFKEKTQAIGAHLRDKFSGDAGAALGMEGVRTLAEIGIGVGVALLCPAANVAAGFVASQGVKVFMTTTPGQKIELAAREKIKQGFAFTKNLLSAKKGQDPQVNAIIKLSDKMASEAKKIPDVPVSQKSVFHEDLKTVGHAMMKPVNAAQTFFKNIQHEITTVCQSFTKPAAEVSSKFLQKPDATAPNTPKTGVKKPAPKTPGGPA